MHRLKHICRQAMKMFAAAMVVSGMALPATAAATYTFRQEYVDYTYLSDRLAFKQMDRATITSSGEYYGLPAYCLEYSQFMASSGTAMQTGSLQQWLNENCSETAARGIRCASIYGFPNFNNGVDNENANYIATQFIIWEYAEGFRTSSDGNNPTAGLNGTLTSAQVSTQKKLRDWLGNQSFDIRQRFYVYSVKKYPEIETAYISILNNIKNHIDEAVPSFQGQTVTLNWSEANKRYEADVTDTNNVLNNGWYWKASCDNANVQFSFDNGNHMTIYSTVPVASATITMTKKLPSEAKAAMTLNYSGKQTMLLGTVPPGTRQVTLSLKTNDLKWNAVVQKVDAETGMAQGNASLDGAVYTLYKDGTAVKEYTVQNGGFTTDTYDCTVYDNVYTLKETKAPTGYQLDSTVYKLNTGKANFSTGINNIKLTVSDNVVKGRIQIKKHARNTVSDTSQNEKGAVYKVWLKSAGSYDNAANSARDIITIGSDGIGTSKNLPYGTYCIRQESGWTGYDIDSTVYEAVISTNGTTITQTAAGAALDFYNDIWKGELNIVKTDSDTKMPLAGAQFTLTGSDGSTKTGTTDSNGTLKFDHLVYGVTYTWQETKAPDGYQCSEETGTWSVAKQNDSVTLTRTNKRIPASISVHKTDADGKSLAGCTFLLEYQDGDTWKPVVFYKDSAVTKGGCTSEGLQNGCLTTGKDGIIRFSGLYADETLKYRLTEIAVPEGYTLLKKAVFEGRIPAENNSYDLEYTVHNGRAYTMPATGGKGFSWCAGFLCAIGVGLLVFRRTKRREKQ